MYERVEPLVSKVSGMGSKQWNLSSSMTPIGKKGSKAATYGEAREDNGIRGAQTKKVGLEENEEKVLMMDKEVKTQTSRDVGTENVKHVRTGTAIRSKGRN